MDRDPNRTALREARRLQSLGGIPSICAFCSYEGSVIPVTLKWLKAHGVPKKLLEDHHVRCRKHDPELKVLLCRNCHGECSEGLLREGITGHFERDPREGIALSLEAQAAFFEDFAKAQRRLADRVRLRNNQQRSLEPEGYDRVIAEIERKLASPQDERLRDFWAYLLHEKDGRSWQEIGEQLYKNVKSEEARRMRARRAWERANRRLK